MKSALAITALLMGSVAPAHAGGLTPADVMQPETTPHWYGGELLLADGVGAALAFVGATRTDSLGWLRPVGGVSLAVTPAILHLTHDRPGAALGSLGLRIGLPALALAAVDGTCHDAGENHSCLGTALLSLAGAGLLGAVIDDAALAWEQRPTRRASAIQLGVAPRAEGGLAVSVSGAF